MLVSVEHFSFKYVLEIAFVKEISPQPSGLFFGCCTHCEPVDVEELQGPEHHVEEEPEGNMVIGRMNEGAVGCGMDDFQREPVKTEHKPKTQKTRI